MLSKESFISSKILFEETFQCVTKVVMERSKKTSKSLDFRQECLPLFYTTVDWTMELLLSGKIISIGLFNGILETKYVASKMNLRLKHSVQRSAISFTEL